MYMLCFFTMVFPKLQDLAVLNVCYNTLQNPTVGVVRNNALPGFSYKLYDPSLLPRVIYSPEGVNITVILPDRIRTFIIILTCLYLSHKYNIWVAYFLSHPNVWYNLNPYVA